MEPSAHPNMLNLLCCVLLHTIARSSKAPEARRKTRSVKATTGATDDVLIGPLDDRVGLRNARLASLMQDIHDLAGLLEFS